MISSLIIHLSIVHRLYLNIYEHCTGEVRGKYGYIDSHGELKETTYGATAGTEIRGKGSELREYGTELRDYGAEMKEFCTELKDNGSELSEDCPELRQYGTEQSESSIELSEYEK